MSAEAKLEAAAAARQRLNGIAWTPRLADVQDLADVLVGVGGLSYTGAKRAADAALKFTHHHPAPPPASPAETAAYQADLEQRRQAALEANEFEAQVHGRVKGVDHLAASPAETREGREPDAALVEAVSAKVHDAWMETKRAQGVESRPSEWGEEQMVPYAALSERAKDLDRGTVKAVLTALAATSPAAVPLPEESWGGRMLAACDETCEATSLHHHTRTPDGRYWSKFGPAPTGLPTEPPSLPGEQPGGQGR